MKIPKRSKLSATTSSDTGHHRRFESRMRRCNTNDEIVTLFNTTHFTISIGRNAKHMVVEELPDGDMPLRFYGVTEFGNKWSGHRRKRGARRVSVASIFLQHPRHRTYGGRLRFRPPGSPFTWSEDDDYNTWRGYACEPKHGNWSRLKNHIAGNLCGGNAEHLDYLLNWMAHLVQFPGRLPGVAVCLHGGQGTGKSAFFKYLAALFPPAHVIQITKREHLVGRFNAHLADRLLVFADEAFFAGDRQIVGELNGVITEERRTIERKGIDAVDEENCVHLIMASNNDWFVHAARDARRFFVLRVGDEHAQDTAYFDAITAQQASGGREAMLHELLHRDLSTFNPRHVPRTAALREQIERSREPHEIWWHGQLADATADTWPRVRVKRDLYRDYVVWCNELRVTHPLSDATLSKYFLRLYGAAVTPSRRLNKGGRQERIYEFPTLDECRRRFDPEETWTDGKADVAHGLRLAVDRPTGLTGPAPPASAQTGKTRKTGA